MKKYFEGNLKKQILFLFLGAFFSIGSFAGFAEEADVAESIAQATDIAESAAQEAELAEFMEQKADLRERFAQIQELNGDVQVKVTSSSVWKIAEKDIKIGQGGEIRTGNDSKVVVSIDQDADSGTIDILSNSWMRLGVMDYTEVEKSKRTMFDLALGQILVKAEGVTGDGSFQIKTPSSTSSVRGNSAIFEVKVEDE